MQSLLTTASEECDLLLKRRYQYNNKAVGALIYLKQRGQVFIATFAFAHTSNGFGIVMSVVYPQPIPELLWFDWTVIVAGLGMGVGGMFEIVRYSVDKKHEHRVYTWTNFWLLLSGVIHLWIEYNFVFARNTSLIKPTLDMYAAADFRYGNYNGMLESGTHAMEVITALIDGPLCFLVVFAAAHNFSWRHPLQIILCVMQLYGLLWFTLQPIYSETGLEGHFSSDPKLFWLIAVGANAPWAIFPTILLVSSFCEVMKAFNHKKSD